MSDFALNFSDSSELAREKALKAKVSKNLLWVGMVSMVMLFAGFTSGYVVRQSAQDWMEFSLPGQFVYNSTLFILLSSITMLFSTWAVKNNKLPLLSLGLVATLGLGIAFTISQFNGYAQLVEMGVYAVGQKSNVSGSFLYIISGLHLLHLLGGFIALLVTIIKSFLKRYDSENRTGVQLCAMYWHFLGLLWLYLASFFGFMHGFDII